MADNEEKGTELVKISGSVSLGPEVSEVAKGFLGKIGLYVGSHIGAGATKRLANAEAHKITMLAKAQSEALLLEADTEIELAKKKQTLNRLIGVEAVKQANCDSIGEQALPLLTSDAKPEHVDDDWINNFFSHARNISNEAAQQLWAAILAHEANSPGAFSKRTLNILAEIDPKDASAFQSLCTFNVNVGGAIAPLITYRGNHDVYRKHDINYTVLIGLEEAGLLTVKVETSYSMLKPTPLVITYSNERWILLGNSRDNRDDGQMTFYIGNVRLTRAGKELAAVCHSEPELTFIEFLDEHFEKSVYQIDRSQQIDPRLPDQT